MTGVLCSPLLRIKETKQAYPSCQTLKTLYFPLWHLTKVICDLKSQFVWFFSLRVSVSLWITFIKYCAPIINYFNDLTYREIPYFTKINISICVKTLLMALESSATASEICTSINKISWVNLNWDDQTLDNLYVFLTVILSQYYCLELIECNVPQGPKGLHKQNTFILLPPLWARKAQEWLSPLHSLRKWGTRM